MRKCSVSLITRGMQIIPTTRHHLAPARGAVIKETSDNGHTCWRMRRKGGPLHCWWGCGLVRPLQKTVRRFLQTIKIKLPRDPAISTTTALISFTVGCLCLMESFKYMGSNTQYDAFELGIQCLAECPRFILFYC